ncbi:TPA: ddrA [Citrobacter freundii]|nr:ddrA [Citrobacter freundii]HCB1879972.1 ddrA [Citrobacter freundii]
MNLSALERLDLNDRLDELMVQATTAKGLDLLDLNDEIDAILVKLGYGTESIPADPSEDNTPSIVKDFLSGKFVKQAQMDFVDTLRQVGEYLNEFLTLDDMKGQANAWVAQNDYAI